MNLNDSQRKAVETLHGRVLVLAGAGSGKTRVIVHRTENLILKGVDPSSILALTFTNKAAEEMRSRVASLVGNHIAKELTFSTFHSFCMQILRKEIERLGYTRSFSLYDEKDMSRLIKQLVQEMLNHKGELPSLAPTRAALTDAFNKGFSEEDENWHDGFSKDLFQRVNSSLRAYNALSFDHLILLTIELFVKHPNILEKYQDRFRYLMIDEYQDTNPTQFKLADLLASKYNNICVVGDDDQSIYGFRGAEVQNILEFKADHIIKLEQNYRSTPMILDAANAVIENNQNRYKKKLWSGSQSDEKIEVFNAANDLEEATSVVNRLIQFHSEGVSWNEMAILYRSNILSRQFELVLSQASWQKEGQWVRGIPYEVFGGLEFSERSEIKDLFAYLRVIANPLDQEALLRIINVPRRGISDRYLDQITQKNRSEKVSLWSVLKKDEKPAIQNFVKLIEEAQKDFETGSPDLALQDFLEKINYKKAIEEEVKSEKMRAFKWENVQECIHSLKMSEEKNLQDFIAHSTLNKNIIQGKKKKKEDRVSLLTFHSAKGLEFENCFLVGLEDGILPHEKSVLETGLEEERRLFYVGITRAKKRLCMSMARTRLKMGKPKPTNPSRFLFEIPKHLLKVTDAKRVF